MDRPYNTKGIRFLTEHTRLKSAIHIEGTLNNPKDTDQYWSVEMAIPMRALTELKRPPRGKPEIGEQWRINFQEYNGSMT